MAKSKIKDSDYLGLTAMLRAREAKMLDSDKLERLIAAADFQDAAKQLLESGYPDMSGMGIREIDGVLSARRSAALTELSNTDNAENLSDLFRVKYDYHNIKVMVKSQGAAVSLLSGSGRVEPEKIAGAFSRDEYDSLPTDMRSAIGEAKNVLARTGDPQLADISIDKAYFAQLGAVADSIGSHFVREYVRLMADSANLRTAVRVFRMGKGFDFLRGALIEGGTIRPENIVCSCSFDSVMEIFGSTRLAPAVALGQSAMSGGKLTAFERECDNIVSDYLSAANLIGFGAEPVVAYIAYLENEITSVRIILTGKLSGSGPEIIRERLRDCHV